MDIGDLVKYRHKSELTDVGIITGVRAPGEDGGTSDVDYFIVLWSGVSRDTRREKAHSWAVHPDHLEVTSV